MRFFLTAHRDRALFRAIPQTCLLNHAAAALDHLDLTLDFEVDRLLHKSKGVDVLELRARAEFLLTGLAH